MRIAFRLIEMRVRLIKKLAERIDGVDLSANEPGDMLDLAPSEGKLLLAEGWAIVEPTRHHRRASMSSTSYGNAAGADRVQMAEL